MEDALPEETREQQDSSKERSPCGTGVDVSHLGALQCTHCLIFATSKFQEHHMKWEHPASAAQRLQRTLFICFTYNCSFLSSKALITHQRSHSPTTRPSLRVAPTTAQPTFPCSDGKTFGQAVSPRWHRQVHKARTPPGSACTEHGRDLAQEAERHLHYIRHAHGELRVQFQPSPGHWGFCGCWMARLQEQTALDLRLHGGREDVAPLASSATRWVPDMEQLGPLGTHSKVKEPS
ncbi:LOW QUALITY PROTEIN: zinc finger protein 576 [Glossophaga mutica]